MAKTTGIVVGSLVAVGAATGAAFVIFQKSKNKDELAEMRVSSMPSRTLLSVLSINRRPPSWYQSIPIFRLRNKNGMEVHISPIGAAITQLVVPDKSGKKADIVLGYDDVEDYVKGEPCTYFGVVVGRCANRIAGAKFVIEGEEFKVLANDGDNALHGGALGLHKRRWDASEYATETHQGVELRYDSPNGEEGYPGNLHITVTYQLAKETNELTVHITASTDEETPVNIVQHSYFNLAGHGSGETILGHKLVMPNADHYTPVKSDGIPTGEIKPVAGTPFDFTSEHTIGERIAEVPGGYDHNYVLHNLGVAANKKVTKSGGVSDKPELVATLTDPVSGRCMEVLTTAPGIQLYTGNFLDGEVSGKAGVRYQKHAGVCLETQGFPDSVNQKMFPSVMLSEDVTYVHQTVYRFK